MSQDSAPSGPYKVGSGFVRSGEIANANQGYGLQESGGGQSGIQGLLSSSVSLAESYVFPAGELAPRALRIMVVHLTPGTVWQGR